MIAAPDLPLWVAIPTSVLVVAGAIAALLGSIGLLRLRTFYERVHAPTLGTTGALALILLASMLSLSAHFGRAIVHELLIALFVTVTAPVTLVLLVRAALFRDRSEGDDGVPADD